jgi:hypothetical protein
MEAREIARMRSLAQNQGNGQPQLLDEQYANHLVGKWNWLTKGMGLDKWTKLCVSRLCENQMEEFKRAASRRGTVLSEDTSAANIPDYVRFIFPVIRRVWNNLIAPGLVSVQPMTAPVGGVFGWEYKYGTSKGTVTAGQNMIQNFDRNYSSEYVENELIGTGDGATTTFNDTISFLPVKATSLAQQGLALTFTVGGVTTTKLLADKGDGTLIAGSGITSGTISYTGGAIHVVFTTAPDNATPIYVSYYFSMESSSTNVPQVNVDIQLQELKAQSRKLRFNWNSESADDMRAMLGMDIESELVSGVASEMSLEIDREIIQECRNSGTTILQSFDATVPPAITAVEHYRNILTPLTRVSMDIASKTKRGPGNWLVIPTDVAAILSQLETHGFFKSVFSPGASPAGMGVLGRPGFPVPAGPSGYGVYQLGVLQNRWNVFLDQYYQSGEILVGLKGSTFVDAGFVYAPYVPMQVTPTFLEPADFTLRKGMRTRYAKKLLNADFYGRVTVAGL